MVVVCTDRRAHAQTKLLTSEEDAASMVSSGFDGSMSALAVSRSAGSRRCIPRCRQTRSGPTKAEFERKTFADGNHILNAASGMVNTRDQSFEDNLKVAREALSCQGDPRSKVGCQSSPQCNQQVLLPLPCCRATPCWLVESRLLAVDAGCRCG
jgi:hypothetical protein